MPEFLLHENMPLTGIFDRIYREWLMACKNWLASTKPEEELVLEAAETGCRLVRQLAHRMEGHTGSAGQQQTDHAQYAFVALADERLLEQPWAGAVLWQENPLEQRIFGTRLAGEELPARIGQLLEMQNPPDRDLAAIYLRCLMLGFNGSLRYAGSHTEKKTLCRRLFAFAYRREANHEELFSMLQREIFPQPLQLPKQRQLPDRMRLFIAVALMGGAMLALSQVLWLHIERKLEPALEIHKKLPPEAQKGGRPPFMPFQAETVKLAEKSAAIKGNSEKAE